jgi:hypothetical protein
MNVVRIPASGDSALNYARELLQRCESGEVIEVTAIEVRRDQTYIVQGSRVGSRTQTAGMLLDAAMTRLNQANQYE